MPRAPRSVKQQMDAFTAELRERGCTWAEVAAEFQRRWRLNSRQGFREAHRLTQAKVCHLWNEYWPNEPLTTRKLGSWEAWPGPTGNEPPIAGLNRLARIYHCRTADLVDGEDHRDADEHNAPATRSRGRVPVAAGAAGSLCREDIEGVLAALPALASGPLPVAASREEEYDALVRALAQWAASMNRRDVLALVRAAAAAAAASPLLERLNGDEFDRLALISAEPSRVDRATIDHIDAVLRHCMRQEDTLGPQAVLGTVLAQQHLVRSLIPAAPTGEVRDRLLSLLANICRFTAWVLFNLNDFNGANHYYEKAKTAAHHADDDAMNSFVLANWSQLATWRGDPRQGVEHALGAMVWGQRANSKLLVSYACDVGARAYSAVLRRSAKNDRHKDHARCMTSLDQALRELGDADTGDVAAQLLYFYGGGQFLSTKTKCLLDMGDAQAAVEMASRSLAQIDPSFVRNMAFSRLDLARGHLRLRAIDEACEQIGEAARLTCRNTSPRLARSVIEVREMLSPWARTRQVADLDEKLHVLQLIA